MLEKILRNTESQKIFAFLIGFGIIVMLFHRPVPIKNYLAMELDKLEGKEVKVDGRCFIYRVEDATCEIKTKI
jgi:hypothetical protein